MSFSIYTIAKVPQIGHLCQSVVEQVLCSFFIPNSRVLKKDASSSCNTERDLVMLDAHRRSFAADDEQHHAGAEERA
jgi:hypothetical protein